MQNRRIVITGMGVISPMGLDVPAAWRNLIQGRSGIGPITYFDTSEFDIKIAGEVRGFDAAQFMDPKEVRRTDRFTHYALAALEEALAQSRLLVNDHNAFDVGAIIGSGSGGVIFYSNEFAVLHEKGPRRVNPFLIPAITVDAAAVQVAIRTGAQGPNMGVASACATGLDAIGQSFEQIRLGHAEAMFTGSFEAAVMPISIANLDRMRALTHRNDNPATASRPFDATRDGFVPAEGGALLILEEMEHALRRGANPMAEILSYAATSDAAHVTAPDREGAGAGQCMKLAIQRARLDAHDVSYINAHGTATPSGDPAETSAIKQALGDYAYRVPVSSTKSMTGHMMGGAGSFETMVCVQALLSGIVPPTINLHHPDPSCDLDYVPNQARCIDPQVVLTNSFGFGGHNATLALRKI